MGVFSREKLPYLFVALLGLGTFQFNKVISYYETAPILAYNFSIEEEEATDTSTTIREIILSLENITQLISFKDLDFILQYTNLDPKEESFKDQVKFLSHGDIIPISPAYKVPSEIKFTPASRRTFPNPHHQEHKLLAFRIPRMQPGMEYQIEFEVEFPNAVKFKMPSFFYADDNADEVISIEEASFKTWLVRNKLVLNSLFLILVFFAIFVYAIKIK